jgi:hypothetical protein
VRLGGVKIINFPDRVKALFQDDLNRVEWAGSTAV